MTVSISSFSGMLPRTPDALLPQTAASDARNCDFGYGELRNVKGGFKLTDVSNAIKSLYTEDGISFYTWPVEVDAERSPLANSQYRLIYFTTGTDFRMTSAANMQPSGGEPSPEASWRVGVPRPSIAPVLTLGLASDIASASLAFTFHYEYSGVKYQEQSISPQEVTHNTAYTFTPPAKSTGVAASNDESIAALALGYDNVVVGGGDTNTNVPVITWIAQPAGTRVIATGIDQVYNPATGNTTQATYVQDSDGKRHEVKTLFSMTRFTVVYDPAAGQPAQSTATPDQAIPVVRITAKRPDNSVIFDLYSSNSSLGSKDAFWEINLSARAAGGYDIKISGAGTAATKESRAYVYTYANIYNEEGPPSPPAEIDTVTGMDVSVDCQIDTGTSLYAPLKEIRIYRTQAGTDIAQYFYAGSIPLLSGGSGTTRTFVDNVPAALLNEALSSTNSYPPDPDLVGLMNVGNGILAAWKGNEVHFSDAYRPWSWPPQYVVTLRYRVVGAIPHGNGMVVTTVANPYMITGVSPDAMTDIPLNSPQSGASRHAMASVGGVIAYASNDGIVTVIGGQAGLTMSEKFFTREVWRERYGTGLSSMRFSVWDGRLIVFSDTGAFTPFVIRLDEAAGTMSDLPDFSASCAFILPIGDTMYYAQGQTLYQFNGGDALTAQWKSRELVLPKPVNLAAAQAVVKDGNWSIDFYADGDLKHTEAVPTGKTTFTLPDGFKSDRWQIRIQGVGRFAELRIAETGRGLGAV